MSVSSSSDGSATAAAAAAGDSDSLDVGLLLAPLTREAVEMVVLRMLNKHPEDAEEIIAAARRPVDTLEIHHEVNAIANMATSIPSACDEFESFVTRASDYLASGHVRNAAAVLETLSAPVVEWSYDQGKLSELDEEDKQAMEQLLATLENAWQSTLEKCEVCAASSVGARAMGVAAPISMASGAANRMTAEESANARARRIPIDTLARNELEYYEKMLNGWKTKLTKKIGPIFSDPHRCAKKKLAAAAPTTTSIDAAEATPPSSAAAAKVGEKRKGVDADASVEGETKSQAANAPSDASTKPATKKTKK